MIAWFNKRPGALLHESTEDPSMALVGDAVPDWVRLPPELGGEQRRVMGQFQAPCPMCKSNASVRHLEVEGGLFAAECETHGFAWYRRKQPPQN